MSLFGIFGDDDNEEEQFIETFTIGDAAFSIRLAGDDANEDKKCLFATYLWNGAKILSEFLFNRYNFPEKMKGQSVVELGAGGGLPSVMAMHLQARFVCSTDFPSPEVIDILRFNLNIQAAKNKDVDVDIDIDTEKITSNGSGKRYCVMEHKWGEDIDKLLSLNENNENFDVVLASECLWKSDTHDSLLKSIHHLLKRDTGRAYISFSHHHPGREDVDLAFFELGRQKYGLEIVETFQFMSTHMFNDSEKKVFIYELKCPS
jgi:EEF1A N-terminal glycine/lysine methyltransferase